MRAPAPARAPLGPPARTVSYSGRSDNKHNANTNGNDNIYNHDHTNNHTTNNNHMSNNSRDK